MTKVEIYVDDLIVYQNGERKGSENLVLVFEWEDKNFENDDSPGAYKVKDVKDGVPSKFKEEGESAEKKLSRRIFKTTIEGTSVIKVSLLKQEELSKFGKLLGKLLSTGATVLLGTISSPLGAALAKKAAEEIIQFKDKWENVIGEGNLLIDADTIAGGHAEIDFKITERVKESLIKLHTSKERDPHSVLPPQPVTSPAILDFLKDNTSNGTLNLTINIV